MDEGETRGRRDEGGTEEGRRRTEGGDDVANFSARTKPPAFGLNGRQGRKKRTGRGTKSRGPKSTDTIFFAPRS
jgi:hypothetical protein